MSVKEKDVVTRVGVGGHLKKGKTIRRVYSRVPLSSRCSVEKTRETIGYIQTQSTSTLTITGDVTVESLPRQTN